MLPSLYIMFGVAFLQNVVMGYIDASGQSYVIRLWDNHRLKEPLMLGMHAIWSVGAFITPFIVSPFLCELPDRQNATESFNNTGPWLNFSETSNTSVSDEGNSGDIDDIKYPFIIVGCVAGIVAIFALISFFMYRTKSLTRSEKSKSDQTRKSGETLSFKIPMLVMQFVFFFLYINLSN